MKQSQIASGEALKKLLKIYENILTSLSEDKKHSILEYYPEFGTHKCTVCQSINYKCDKCIWAELYDQNKSLFDGDDEAYVFCTHSLGYETLGRSNYIPQSAEEFRDSLQNRIDTIIKAISQYEQWRSNLENERNCNPAA